LKIGLPLPTAARRRSSIPPAMKATQAFSSVMAARCEGLKFDQPGRCGVGRRALRGRKQSWASATDCDMCYGVRASLLSDRAPGRGRRRGPFVAQERANQASRRMHQRLSETPASPSFPSLLLLQQQQPPPFQKLVCDKVEQTSGKRQGAGGRRFWWRLASAVGATLGSILPRGPHIWFYRNTPPPPLCLPLLR